MSTANLSTEESGSVSLSSNENDPDIVKARNLVASASLSTPTKLKRQSSAIQSNLSQLGASSTTLTDTTYLATTKPSSTSQETHFSSFTKFNKLHFSQNSTAKSSTYSSSSSSSSTSSCSSGSNDTPVISNHSTNSFNFNFCTTNPRAPIPKLTQLKQSPTSTSTATTTTTTATTSHSAKPKQTEAPPSSITAASKQFNIENELIKYTKTLKLTNNYLSSYKLGDHIRNGGFSEIYEGSQLKSKDRVIIKLIPKHKTKNWLMVHNKKYPAEVLLHKMSNNIPGVVKMLEFFEQEQEWILVMPKLVNCVDLFDFLESKHRGRLSESEACNFFTQLVKINIELLNHGVVHRDLKSENLLVELDSMNIVLIDFGASAIFRQNQTQPQVYTDFHGTRQYKPPEYITHKKYTAQSSTIWTLGILLYDMCNGQLPFETEQEVLDYDIQMKTSVSDEYKEILFDCLKQDPMQRPQLSQLLEYKWCLLNSNYVFPKTSPASSGATSACLMASMATNASKTINNLSNLSEATAVSFKSLISVESTSSSSSTSSASSSTHSSCSSGSGLMTTTQLTNSSKINFKI